MEKSLEELLLEISFKETETEQNQAAKSFNVFIKHFDTYIKKLAHSQSRGDTAMSEDLHKLMLLDIYEKAALYDYKRNMQDSEAIRIKKWLGYCMKRVLRTYWNEINSSHNYTQPIDEAINKIILPIEDINFENVDINEKKLVIAFTKNKILDERELDIIKTSMQFPEGIPDEIRKGICKHYKIKDSTIRTIRHRALKKVKKFISQSKLVAIN